MAKGLPRIQQVADAYGVTPRALRFYEKLELLPSDTESRTKGNARRYTPKQIDRLERLLSFKAMGFDLETIRQLLDLQDTGDMRGFHSLAIKAGEELHEKLLTQRAALDACLLRLGRGLSDWSPATRSLAA